MATATSKSWFNGVAACTLAIVLASVTIQIGDQSPIKEYLPQNISSTKPYDTFHDFYPHYLNEHRQKITRQWHYLGTSLVVLYLMTNPILLIPMMAGGLSAYAVIPFARHLSTGLAEVVVFLSIYLSGGRALTRSFLQPAIPLLCGYGFSWIGHFVFEHNRPAAFVYPTYSLLGDFHMMYDAIRRQRF